MKICALCIGVPLWVLIRQMRLGRKVYHWLNNDSVIGGSYDLIGQTAFPSVVCAVLLQQSTALSQSVLILRVAGLSFFFILCGVSYFYPVIFSLVIS